MIETYRHKNTLIFLLEELECPTSYHDLVKGSNYCYRISAETRTWKNAKAMCKKDGGELACFSNEKERNQLTQQCNKCWVGYKWKNGEIHKS